MIAHFTHYEACPKCREKGKDSRGDNFGIYSDGSGHCFSCGWHRWPKMELIWNKDEQERVEERQKLGILPYDFESEVPAKCWKWLLQFGLPYSYWQPFVGYSKNHERMVFRVGEPLRFSVGRLFANEGSIRTRKWHCWGDAHASVNPIGKGGVIVLVEDIISAHKVGQYTETIPLFGTGFFNDLIIYLQQVKRPIILWLDSDQQDVIAKKAANLQILTGCPVDVIITSQDPKEIKYEEIRNRISNLAR